MRIAIIIGHTKLSKGAYSEYFGKTEYNFYKQYKNRLEEIADVYTHNSLIPSYTKRQKTTAKKTSQYDLVFELHFNKFNGNAKGCEACYYYKSKYGKELADKFTDTYTTLTGAKKRQSKPLKPKHVNGKQKDDRGFGFVYYQKPIAILVEPVFGDNIDDCNRFNIEMLLTSIQDTSNYYELLK